MDCRMMYLPVSIIFSASSENNELIEFTHFFQEFLTKWTNQELSAITSLIKINKQLKKIYLNWKIKLF